MRDDVSVCLVWWVGCRVLVLSPLSAACLPGGAAPAAGVGGEGGVVLFRKSFSGCCALVAAVNDVWWNPNGDAATRSSSGVKPGNVPYGEPVLQPPTNSKMAVFCVLWLSCDDAV